MDNSTIIISDDATYDEVLYVENSNTDEFIGPSAPMATASISRDPNDFQYLVGMAYRDPDDAQIYITTRIVVERGLIVAYRSIVLGGNQKMGPPEQRQPVHVLEVAAMVEAMARETEKVYIFGTNVTEEGGTLADRMRKPIPPPAGSAAEVSSGSDTTGGSSSSRTVLERITPRLAPGLECLLTPSRQCRGWSAG